MDILIFQINTISLFISTKLCLNILYPLELTVLVACHYICFMVLVLSVKNRFLKAGVSFSLHFAS